MDMVGEHKNALKKIDIIALHKFKLRYKNKAKKIYAFVEGKEDPCFYISFIENNLPTGWDLEIWPCGGKDKVFTIYSDFDWNVFERKQILFFIDQDLSKFTNEKILKANNIYITDGYSIENNIVSEKTCERVLKELCGFSNISYDELDQLKYLFNTQLIKFKKELAPIMVELIKWQKNNIKACYDDICMKHLFNIKNGHLKIYTNPKKYSNFIEYIYKQCNVDLKYLSNPRTLLEDFISSDDYLYFIYGKHVFWFLIKFCISIEKDYKNLSFIKLDKKDKKAVNLSASNSIAIIAPRARCPESLKCFLESTMKYYINFINQRVD